MSVGKVGGFCCASLPSVFRHTNIILRDFPEHVSSENINSFFKDNCNKFLSSIGYAINKAKGIDDYLFKNYKKLLLRFNNTDYLDGLEILIDSAGYQFQTGHIPINRVAYFCEKYYEFLHDNYDSYTNSFIFDPIPGPTDAIVSSYREMVELNLLSYKLASQCDERVRRKMLYIHHFRTPKINKMYKSFIEDHGLIGNFYNYSTGGLVAFSKSSQGPVPCVLYTIPLCYIVKHAKDNNIDKFRFHILGSTDYKDILFHRFAERHIKRTHGIDVEITYDSSTIFQTLMMGRYIHVGDYSDKSIRKLWLRSTTLNDYFHRNSGVTVRDYFYELMNSVCRTYGFKELDPIDDPLYIGCTFDKFELCGREVGKFNGLIYVYGMYLMLKLLSDCYNWADEAIDELYELYDSDKYEEFNDLILTTLFKFNNNKRSKKLVYRAGSYYKSLTLLEDLDLDYCDYIVNRFMAADEPDVLNNVDKGISLF